LSRLVPAWSGIKAARRFDADPAAAEPFILAGLDGPRRRSDQETTGRGLYNGALGREVWRETGCRDFLHDTFTWPGVLCRCRVAGSR
jgi:hypothetical protein